MTEQKERMKLVREECANLVANVCIGMTTRGTLFRHAGKCYIQEGKKCQYYDSVLHPLTAKIVKKKRRRFT